MSSGPTRSSEEAQMGAACVLENVLALVLLKILSGLLILTRPGSSCSALPEQSLFCVEKIAVQHAAGGFACVGMNSRCTCALWALLGGEMTGCGFEMASAK